MKTGTFITKNVDFANKLLLNGWYIDSVYPPDVFVLEIDGFECDHKDSSRNTWVKECCSKCFGTGYTIHN